MATGPFSLSSPAVLLWFGINYLQGDKSRNYSFQNYFVAEFYPLLQTPGGSKESSRHGTVVKGRHFFFMAELEIHSSWGSKGVNPSTLVLVNLVIWEGWIQNEKGRLSLERQDGFKGRSYKVQNWAKLGGQYRAEKQELEEKPTKKWVTEVSRMWGGGKNGGTNIVLFGIKPLGYLCVIPSGFQ